MVRRIQWREESGDGTVVCNDVVKYPDGRPGSADGVAGGLPDEGGASGGSAGPDESGDREGTSGEVGSYQSDEATNFGGEKVSAEQWGRKRVFLSEPCRVSTALMNKGVPRMRIESGTLAGQIVSAPRHLGLNAHRNRLSEFFPDVFISTDNPTGLKLYPLCGRRDCVEVSHLVLAYRRHMSEMEERRQSLYATVTENRDAHWWTDASQFYDAYADIASFEMKSKRDGVNSRRTQSAVRRKLSRKKNRIAPDHILESAVTAVFGKDYSFRMYNEWKTMVVNGVHNVIDKATIDMASRNTAVRSGFIKDHERNYFKSQSQWRKKT